MRLLSVFLNFWTRLDPDIVTGWNIEGFDIPYLVNRITKLLGEKECRRLSPFGWIKTKEITKFNRTETLYSLTGIATLDYLQLYKKFTYFSARIIQVGSHCLCGAWREEVGLL